MERQQRREHNNRSRMAHLGEYEGKVERDCNSGCYWQRDRPTSSILMLLFLSSLFGFSQLFSLFTFTTIKNSVWIKVEESKLWKTKFMFVVQRKCQKCNDILQIRSILCHTRWNVGLRPTFCSAFGLPNGLGVKSRDTV